MLWDTQKLGLETSIFAQAALCVAPAEKPGQGTSGGVPLTELTGKGTELRVAHPVAHALRKVRGFGGRLHGKPVRTMTATASPKSQTSL